MRESALIAAGLGLIVAVVASLAAALSGGGSSGGTVPDVSSDCPSARMTAAEPVPDVLDALYCPGKVTYVRYTSVISPWPTRVELWIDFDSQDSRRQYVQATDSARNPAVWTAIEDGGTLYPFLPSTITQEDLGDVSVIPTFPVRDGTRATTIVPVYGTKLEVEIRGEPRVEDTIRWEFPVTTFRWEAEPLGALDESVSCDTDVAPTFFYEYTADSSGMPVSEWIIAACGDESGEVTGNVYHEIRFRERDELPDEFFDRDAVSRESVSEIFSGAELDCPNMYWLGPEAGRFKLFGIGTFGRCPDFSYAAFDPAQMTGTLLELTVGEPPPAACDVGVPLGPDAPDATLCAEASSADVEERWVEWRFPSDLVVLSINSTDPELTLDEIVVLAKSLHRYDEPFTVERGPRLSEQEAIELVGDALDWVCPEERAAVRVYRDSAHFEYDEDAGEWRGEFGTLGEWAVTDPGGPVAWPVANREQVEEEGGSYAAGYAECYVEGE